MRYELHPKKSIRRDQLRAMPSFEVVGNSVKLSDDKVRAIRKALKTMTRDEVARTEGVSISVVRGIADELNYTAVKDE